MCAFFNHAGASPPSSAVVDAMVEHLRRESDIGGYHAAIEATDALGQLRGDLGVLLNASAHEVALTTGATDGWERAFWSVITRRLADRRAGSRIEIVVDQFAYATVWSAMQRWSLLEPIRLIVAPSLPQGTVDIDRLGQVVRNGTALAVLTHIPTHVGTVTDVRAAIVALRALATDVVVCVDVSQSIGQLPIDVVDIDCDVAFAPGRKFLRGPRGTGVLFVRSALADSLIPLSLPYGSEVVGDQVLGMPEGARRFEVFERSIASLVGFGVATAELLDIGPTSVADAVAIASRRVVALIDHHPQLTLTGTRDDRGIISFVHTHREPAEVAAQLDSFGVTAWVNPAAGAPLDATTRGHLPSVRLSPHHSTTENEFEHLAVTLQAFG